MIRIAHLNYAASFPNALQASEVEPGNKQCTGIERRGWRVSGSRRRAGLLSSPKSILAPCRSIIFEYMLEKAEYRASEAACKAIELAMASLHGNRDGHFGNGRVVRNLFEHVQQEHANRLASITEPTREGLLTIEASDIADAMMAIQPVTPAEHGSHVDGG